MKTISLNQYNSSFRIEGNEQKRSLNIKGVKIKEGAAAGDGLKLLVIDEKDITIYSQPLEPGEAEEGEFIEVGKRFAFYDHLSVKVEGKTNDTPFSVEVSIE